MAINIDTVYKSVLSVLNKEQRGYLTPDEFNKIAKQAQIKLLDVAFLSYNKLITLDTQGRVNAGYADIPEKTKEFIDVFYKTASVSLSLGVGSLPTDVYKTIELTNSDRTLPFELVDKHELPYLLSSPLTKPSADYPVYYKTTTSSGATSVQVNPITISTATIDYIKVPTDPRWGYTRNATYGTNTYDSNPYISNGIILGANDTAIIDSGNSGLMDSTQTIVIGTTTGVSTSGSGTEANITLTISSNVVTAITVNSVGSGFAVDDTITISNTLGWTGADDLVLKLRSEDIYSSTTQGSIDFELHPAEEPPLVTHILALAGVTIGNLEITQQASQSAQVDAALKQQ
jgi:hypothetical protein